MPRAVQLNDGRILRARGDIPDAAFDKIADGVEAGSQPPAGFTIEGPAYQPPNLSGGEPTDEKSALRRGYEAMSGPATTVRDVTTQAVGQAVQGVAAMAPEAMSLGDQLQQAGVPREAAAQALAQQIVPQTPDQLVSTLALGGLGPVSGAAGAFLRATVPALAGASTRALLGQEQDPAQILGQIVGSVIGEGVGPALSQITKRKMLRVQQDKLGDEFAKVIGEGVDQVTSVKNMRTPDQFLKMLGDKKPHDSLYWREASANIDKSEDEITKTIIPAMAQMTPAQRDSVLSMMEDAAGRKPTLTTPTDAPPSLATPVNRTHEVPADTLFKEALTEKRRLRQAASKAESQEAKDAWDLHDAQSEKIRSNLATIHTELADQYTAMNDQFRTDMQIGDILWRMKEAGAWVPGHDRAHFNAPEAASVLSDSMGVSKKTKFMGGPDKIMEFLSGPSGVPGAMPMSHEGVLRMFMQLVQGAPSISAGGKSRMVTVPTAPVMSSHAKALSDYLATNLIRGMAEKVTGTGGP